MYIKKIVKNSPVVDVPCFIDNEVVEKFLSEFVKMPQDAIDFLSSFKKLKKYGDIWTSFELCLHSGENLCLRIRKDLNKRDAGILQVLAPLMKNPIYEVSQSPYGTPCTTRSPINIAARLGYTNIVYVLAPLVKNFNVTTFGGYTPLHYAVNWGNIDVVKFLTPLTKNDVKSYEGHTPIEMARMMNGQKWYEIVKFLESYRKI